MDYNKKENPMNLRNLFLIYLTILSALTFGEANKNLIESAKTGNIDGVKAAFAAGANIDAID